MASGITYATKEERPVTAADVRRLYDGAGWWPGWDLSGIERAVAASVAVGAWDGERLVGFARAVSDGEHRAYVEDVVIDPDYRGRKIGEGLVSALVAQLSGVHIVSLFAEPERVAFYERNGFRPSPTAVMLHREAPAKQEK
jgi:ribosomal protein S18 acetylase RimI-like enzyme